MNVALARVLYAHALAAAPRLALGRLAALGRLLGDPRLGMAGVFLSLRRVLFELVRDGHPIYAWPVEQRHVWRTPADAVRSPGTRTRHKGSLRVANWNLRKVWRWTPPEAGRQLATSGSQRERDPHAANPGEDRHGAAGPHLGQNQLEQGDRVT